MQTPARFKYAGYYNGENSISEISFLLYLLIRKVNFRELAHVTNFRRLALQNA